MSTIPLGSIDPPTAADEVKIACFPRTIAETVPDTLGVRPSFAQSNRPLGAEPQTEQPLAPDVHFGNTPMAPTLSLDSPRRTCGSIASRPGEGSNQGDQLLKTLPVTAAAASHPPPSAAVAPTQVQTLFLEPTQLIDTAIDAGNGPSSLPAAMPAALLPTQLLQATQVQPQMAEEQEESQEQQPEQQQQPQRISGIIPETDEDNFNNNKDLHSSLPKTRPATQLPTSKPQTAANNSAPPTAPPAATVELPANVAIDYAVQIAEIENQLRERWLGSHPASEEQLGTMHYTATNAATQISSYHGSFAEAIQLVDEWYEKVKEGDDLCNLRISLLSVLQEEIAEVLFGPEHANKLSAVVCSNWVWSFAECFRKVESMDESFPLLEKLTFSIEKDADNDTGTADDPLGDMDEGETQEFAAFLCTKEEFAKRREILSAAEAAAEEDCFLGVEIGPPKGVAFTKEELIAKLDALMQNIPVVVPPSDTAGAVVEAAAMEVGGQQEQQQQHRPETETEAGVAPATAMVIENDGPDALDVGATHPSNNKEVPATTVEDKEEKKEDKQETVDKKTAGSMDAAAAADGPHELQVDLTAPHQPTIHNSVQQDPPLPAPIPIPSSDNHPNNHSIDNLQEDAAGGVQKRGHQGWMDGTWKPPGGSPPNTAAASPAPGAELAANAPASADQNTPSGMFKNKDGGGDGSGGGSGDAGVVISSMVPETQPEQIKPFNQRHTEGMESIVRPAAPGAVLNIPAAVVAATAPGTESDAEGSQPVGSQKLQDALRGVGLLAEEMDGASQQEAENPSAPLKLFGKNAAAMAVTGPSAAAAASGSGGAKGTVDGFAVPAPRKSSRLGPGGGANKAPEVEKQVADKQQQKQPQSRRLSGSKLVPKRSGRRDAYLDKVMEKNRTDLGVGGVVRIVKAPAVASTKKQPERQQKQQQQQQQQQQPQRAVAEEVMPVRRTSDRHILLSGLHDTADCYELDGTDSTAPNPVPSSATEHAKGDGNVPLLINDQNQDASDPFHFPSDAASPSETSPAPLRGRPRKSPRKSSDKSPRKSPRRPLATAAAAGAEIAPPQQPAAVPRQPYQPAPIVQNIGGLILTRLPHPMLMTAPDCSMDIEVSIAEGVVEVQAPEERRASPRKRQQNIEAEEMEAGRGPDAVAPRSKKQKIVRDTEEAGPSRNGRRQSAATPEPADSEDQTIKERWLSTGGKRKQGASKTTSQDTDTVDKEAGMSSPRRKRAAAEVAEKKLKSSSGTKLRKSERPPGVDTGCSKCRYSKNGCAACDEDKARARAEANAKKINTEAAPAAAAQGKRSPKKSLAALRAAPLSRRQLSSLAPAAPAAKSKQQPVSTLPTPALKVTTTTAAGPLQGMCFLVSGSGEGTEGKGAVEELIISLGGRVLADLPAAIATTATPAGQSTINRRLSVDLRSPSALPPVDAVIADRNARRAKCIYAAIKGLPVVSPEWLKACKRGKKRASWTGKYQLLAEANPAPAPVFAGLRVYLKVTGKKSVGQSITQLMQHAGAQMTGAPKESNKDYETSCDLIIIDDDVTAEARGTLERLARRLRIPCHTRDWAIRAMLEGTLPDDFAAPTSAKQQKTSAGRKRPAAAAAAAAPSPDRALPENEEMQADDVPEDRDAVPEPSPSVEFVENLVEAAEEVGAAAVESAAVRRSRRKNSELSPEEDIPLPPARRRKSSPAAIVPPPANQIQTAAPSAAAPAAASPEPTSFKWIGEPTAPPQGCTPAGRRYYNAVVYNNEEIQVGSHVELSSMPGESAPRVAQVAALWAERDVNGHDKPFGRFIRLLRPDDTSLALAFLDSQKKQVFMSTVEEPRLSLKGIERKCRVAFPSCADELTHATQESNGQSAADYVCMAQYDLENGVLKPLPQ